MSQALVVCPVTDDLELIDYCESPLGPLVHACSRFRPVTALACSRDCVRCTRTEAAAVDTSFDTSFDASFGTIERNSEVDLRPTLCAESR